MKYSAGILLYRRLNAEPEFFLVHPGGPYFKNKDRGWWTIPKGEPGENEDLLKTALREFHEETGYSPKPPYIELEPITQKGGKKVFSWAAEGNLDATTITCNDFEVEWPPKSGNKVCFPEIDKANWFTYDEAIKYINERQILLLQQTKYILENLK